MSVAQNMFPFGGPPGYPFAPADLTAEREARELASAALGGRGGQISFVFLDPNTIKTICAAGGGGSEVSTLDHRLTIQTGAVGGAFRTRTPNGVGGVSRNSRDWWFGARAAIATAVDAVAQLRMGVEVSGAGSVAHIGVNSDATNFRVGTDAATASTGVAIDTNVHTFELWPDDADTLFNWRIDARRGTVAVAPRTLDGYAPACTVFNGGTAANRAITLEWMAFAILVR